MRTITVGIKSFLVWLIFAESVGEFKRTEWVCRDFVE
jgi:hypothetical protein